MSELRSIIRSVGEDAWSVAHGSIDGRPSTVLFRRTLAEVAGHPALPRRLLITWDYGDDGDTGMPAEAVARELEAFEAALHAALDPSRAAVLAFVFTHVGTREWHYYFDDVDAIEDAINEALAEQPDLPISIKAFDDPEWAELSSVLRRLQNAP